VAVLSIQSHVVYGYAGNAAAVFPLQRLGREVWAVNTVEFSNHTGYGSWQGDVLSAELAARLIKGLEERGVLRYAEAALSGYLGDAAIGKVVKDAVIKIKRESPGAVYCCDPVMGDAGHGFYVKPGILEMFKEELVPIADIITPNQFEAEALSQASMAELCGAYEAVDALHAMGPRVVLVTSYREKEGEISMLASDKTNLYKVTTPEIALGADVSGTGDVAAALFLSRYLETGNLKQALEMCAASIFGVLQASVFEHEKESSTLKEGGALKEGSAHNEGRPVMELKLISAQEELCWPSHVFEAVKL
jgi:pyridoxine kinase